MLDLEPRFRLGDERLAAELRLELLLLDGKAGAFEMTRAQERYVFTRVAR